MKLRDWLKASNVSIKSFSEELGVERAMVYRYFTGAMPRARTIRRIELLTAGAVTAQDFYDSAMEHKNSTWQQERKVEPPAAQSSTSTDTARPPERATSRSFAWPDLSNQNIALASSGHIAGGLNRAQNTTHRPTPAVLSAAITHYILDGKGTR